MSFNQFRISSDILRGLKDVNLENPTPLQKKIIKALKDGRDLLVKAASDEYPETGYLVPILDQIARQDRRQGTKLVILTPYPERAEKLESWIQTVGTHAGLTSSLTNEYGEKEGQTSHLMTGPATIVATPDRLAEIMEEKRMIFRDVKHLVLDTADRFESLDAVEVIIQRSIGSIQRIATVSETDNPEEAPVYKLLTDPALTGFEEPARGKIEIQEKKNQKPKKEEDESSSAPSGPDAESPEAEPGEPGLAGDLTQYYMRVPPRMKITTLIAHLDETPSDRVVIFAASNRTADRLYRVLRKSGRRAASIHSGLDQATSDERMERFTANDVQNLIVGGLSAGSLTIGPVTQVINYDVPEETAEYKLRADIVGDGTKTRIVSLVSKQDRSDILELIDELGYAPEEVPLPEKVTKKKSKSSSGGKKEKKSDSGKKKEKSRDKSSKRGDSRSSGNSRGKSESKSSGKSRQKSKKRRPEPGENDTGPMELPRPSFDKLSGGRSGKKEEKGWLKKIFGDMFS